MKNTLTSLLGFSLLFSCAALTAGAESETKGGLAIPSQKAESQKQKASSPSKFTPFTGKISKTRVRMRLQPGYDGIVLREMNPNDYVVVTEETEDFYGVKPPNDFRGYVFRSYILDGIVEADRVNIRISPDREATIIGQLKSGDQVEATPSAINNKWYEIKIPSKTRYYIAKEYINKVGDANFKDRLEKKRDAAYNLLKTTDEMSQAELKKPFDQMNITGIKANYQHLINDYPEFPEIVAKATESFTFIQQGYNASKLSYLEEQSRITSSTTEANRKLNAELQAHKMKINHLENQIEKERQYMATPPSSEASSNGRRPIQLPVNMSIWIPAEERLFNAWSLQNGHGTPQEFYDQQKEQGFVMTGFIDTYNRSVRNKPGDYLLLNPVSKLPIAFLYSTKINLQDYVGHEISIRVSPRDNFNFAFPAYFVLGIE